MTALLVVLLVGATIRLTRLVTADHILERPRVWVERRLSDGIAYMVRCDWCVSFWVGLSVFLFGWYAPDTIVWIVSGALTASLVTGWSTLISTSIEVTVWGEPEPEEGG